MGIKAHELLRKLITLGMTGVNINSTLDADTAKIVASEFAWDVSDVAVTEEEALVLAQGGGEAPEEETEIRLTRPPVVTVMGHVDHGKTSLLDRIRKANVVASEAGGITQHIGAYNVEFASGRLTFLDTPGHEAFTAMRARGAKTTDIVVLVVAADDGVMPQTREAINHAKSAKVPIVVAINKCDKPDAQPERVRRELSEFGLMPEEWGGETQFSEVSAQTGKGVDELIEKIVLQAEMLDLRANPNKPAVGVVIEAQLDRGRGPVATVLITDGTLNRGDVVLAGAACGKVRAMLDSYGRNCSEAGPATPIEVIGLNDVPAAGDPVHVVKDMKKALEIADTRKNKERRSLMPSVGPRLTLEDLYKAMKETEQLELKVIVKGDVQGSVEAVSDALTRLSTEKVKVTVVHAAAGAITEGDVNLAVAAGSIIIGFNVRPAGKAASLAIQEKVEIRHYTIIYNVVDDVKAAMEGLLAPSLIEKITGKAEVRQVFRISKAGNVAGCMVIEGLVRRAGSVRILRDNAVLWQGKMSSLKRFKDDVREVKEGFDCGISLEGYQELKEHDVLECYEVEEVRQSL
jgi:translation initiation factor IF-2